MSDIEAGALLLAVEPDPRAAAVLRRVLENRVHARLMVVESIDAALAILAGQVPDVILTSTFLPPGDLTRLADILRHRQDATHIQVITTPHFLEPAAADPIEDEARRVLRFPRPRASGGRFHCDPAVLRQQVDEYLEQARVLRAMARDRAGYGRGPGTGLVLSSQSLESRRPDRIAPGMTGSKATNDRDLNSLLRPADRRRSYRLRAAELAGQWGVKIDVDSDARIVDISRTGIRLETATRLAPGSMVNVEVIGMDQNHEVWARLIRSEAVEVQGPDVRYRAAGMFVREIDLFTAASNPIAAAVAADSLRPPTALADLLGRVLRNANWVSNGPWLISSFECELCELVGAREVRIRTMPVQTAHGCRSLWFQIPASTDAHLALHVVFDRGHRPTAAEFRLLKAAASLAALMLDLAHAGGMPSTHRPTIQEH